MVDLRNAHIRSIKKMFVAAALPDFFILTSTDSALVERALVKKTMGCNDAEAGAALRERYYATQMKRTTKSPKSRRSAWSTPRRVSFPRRAPTSSTPFPTSLWPACLWRRLTRCLLR